MNAPRITPADVEANITSEHYFTAWDGVLLTLPEDMFRDIQKLGGPGPKECLPLRTLTFCVLVLRNGHTVAGEAHCQDPAKFDAEIGRIEARKNAISKLWPMVVYAERTRLSATPTDHRDRVRAEAAELDSRIQKLTAFLSTDYFANLSKAEQDRMTAQRAAMLDYSNCLSERISAFAHAD